MEQHATDEERMEMLSLMDDPANETEVKKSLFDVFQSPKSLQDVNPEVSSQILEAIFQSDTISHPKLVSSPRISRFNVFKWTAAAAVLFALLTVGFYFLNQRARSLVKPTAQHIKDILPGGNRAMLTLSDGSVISLTDASKGKIASQAGIVITKKADGQLSYQLTGQKGGMEGFNTISTPVGGKYEVILQDGTKVMLNAASKITYPLSFKGDIRKITLTGEAYFEVAKDKHKPFIVATPSANHIKAQEIRVLGTHFNVSAYPDEQAYVTTLLEGSIKIAIGDESAGKLLKPGQQAMVSQYIKVEAADPDAAVAWKNDIFYFSDEPVQNIMRKLGRWYNVEVEFRGTIAKTGLWGQISMKKSLSEVLEVLEETGQVHFNVQGRRVIVMQ